MANKLPNSDRERGETEQNGSRVVILTPGPNPAKNFLETLAHIEIVPEDRFPGKGRGNLCPPGSRRATQRNDFFHTLANIKVGNEGKFLGEWRAGCGPLVIGLALLFVIGYIKDRGTPGGYQKNTINSQGLPLPTRLRPRSVSLSSGWLSIRTKEGRAVIEAMRVQNPAMEISRIPKRFRVERVRVVHITDGDTVILEDGRIIRYKGFNSPEVGGEEEPGGREASEENSRLLRDKRVILVVPLPEEYTYERLVGYLFAPWKTNGGVGKKVGGDSKGEGETSKEREYVSISHALFALGHGDHRYGSPDSSLPVFLKDAEFSTAVKTKSGRAKGN